MNRFLLVLSIWILAGQASWAAIAHVQSTTCVQSTAATHQCITGAFNTTTGRTNVVVVALANLTTVVSSVVDSGGSTYAARGACGTMAGSSLQICIWSTAVNASIASTSVTVNTDSNTKFAFAVGEYSGVVALGLTNNGSNSSSATSSIAQSTQDANNWIIAGFTNPNITTNTANTGNMRQTASTTTSSGVTVTLNDNTSASAGSVTNTINVSPSATAAKAVLELRTSTTSSSSPNLMLMGVGE
jgi:hypothetical protein